MSRGRNSYSMWTVLAALCVFALTAMGCGGSDAVDDADIERAQSALKPFKMQLKAALKEGMQDGPENAVWVCRDKAPEIAASLRTNGIEMGRTSQKVRNPENAPEPWMEPLLAEYIERGDDRTHRAVRLDDGSIGYVEPVYVQPLCLKCHGDEIGAPVQTKISELYPSDDATGFAAGDFRGLFWVRMAKQ